MIKTLDIKKFQNRTSKSIRCLAIFKAEPGKGKELEKILLTLEEPTRSEPGNIAYVLHRSTKDPDELLFDEIWVDMRALDDHFKQPYIRSLAQKINPLLEAPVEIKTYSEI